MGSGIFQKFELLKKTKIKQQLYFIYFAAIVLPITIIGSFLLINTSKLLTNYHRDLLESDNLRVKTILFEITTQVYNISEELTFDNDLREMLGHSYYIRSSMEQKASEITILDNYSYNHAEIEGIEIYTDNPSFMEYKQFHPADETVQSSEWFQKAVNQSSVFWYPMMTMDKYGNEYWNLCLIRKIPLKNSAHNAVLVIKISDNYLKTRINSQEYAAMISVDKEPVFYSSNRELYGSQQPVAIDYEEDYFQYVGTQKINGRNCFVEMSTLHMYQSESRVYIFTMNDQAYRNISNIILICLLIIALAILIPGIIIHYFTVYFTSRVLTLRQAMHQASNEDYEIVNSVRGQDELSEAFSDLEIMVQKIKQKDADMYEARINEKELVSAQQAMEFKMLASQINPHFLYNTLETIRMKAFTVGDKEVATAIKLLGKSMRYVLENTGTSFTTLDHELEHVENYLAIQKLRFGEKFDSCLEVAPQIQLAQLYILPLLLQPVVENALLHGLEEKEANGRIVISIYRQQDFINIDVSDNGCGMDEKELSELQKNIEIKDMSRSKSIGLYNINQRMKLSYGEDCGIQIYSAVNEGTTIRLCILEEKMKTY
ncbi:MAG: histidine kinase [Bacillota bacterium]|nr:histidine kinase [Bacillota bacterium]